jgi:hypothetical protein
MLDVVIATRAVAPDDQLASALPLLRDTLARIAAEARHTVVVTDAAGRVLRWDGRVAATAPHHRWTAAACPVHDPDAGAVIGAVDIAHVGAAPAVHPTVPALITAAAGLAEGLLVTQQAVRDELLLARHLPLLDRLPGRVALLSPSGRVVAARPPGWVPARVAVPAGDAAGPGVLSPLPGGWLLHRAPPPAGTRG